MFISRRMTKKPVVARSDYTCVEALRLMKAENVDKLPVLSSRGELVGVITEKDILRAHCETNERKISILEQAFEVSTMTIDRIMSRDVVSCRPDTSIEEVSRIMVTMDLSFLPVTDEDGRLVGLVSKSDMFKILMELSGARHYGTRISFTVVDKIGTIANISKALSDNNISIIAFCTYLDPDPSKVICSLKVEGADEAFLVKLLSPFVADFVDLGERSNEKS